MSHEETFSHEPSTTGLSLAGFTVLLRLRFTRQAVSCRIADSQVHPAGAGLAADELSWPDRDGALHHIPDRCKTCPYRGPERLLPSLPRECTCTEQALPGYPERRRFGQER